MELAQPDLCVRPALSNAKDSALFTARRGASSARMGLMIRDPGQTAVQRVPR